MQLIVTGSIAFDYLMSFPGKFTEHFLPEHMNRVSLSFLVDSMDKRRGGCAPNIAYTLALLGERPRLMATAGQDFSDYKQWMDGAGIDTSLVKTVADKFCASFFCSTDQHNNQIASFYTGAMANAAELSFRGLPGITPDALVIIAPNDPDAMVQYAEECSTTGIQYIWDPGQQCARMDGAQLKDGILGAFMVICNDYEFELMRQKTGMSEQDVLKQVPLLVVTKGENGLHGDDAGQRGGRAGGDAGPDRRSHGRRRRVPRRLHEGPGGRRGLHGVRPLRQRGRHLRTGASGRHLPRLHVGRVQGALHGALRSPVARQKAKGTRQKKRQNRALTLNVLPLPASSAVCRLPSAVCRLCRLLLPFALPYSTPAATFARAAATIFAYFACSRFHSVSSMRTCASFSSADVITPFSYDTCAI